MRKIIAGFAISLDGFIEGPNGEYDWIIIDKEIDFAAFMARHDTYFMGRKSYEKVQQMAGNSFSGNKMYVFSNTLKEVDPNYILINGNVKEQVMLIKKQPGKDIALWGGAGLLASLLDLELVDEIDMSIIPVLLGQGKPMVDVLKHKILLDLIDIKKYSNGTVALSYKINYTK